MDFAETVRAHLAAIQARDFDAWLDTVTHSDDLTLILPNGALFEGRAAVSSAIATWLADPDWSWEVSELRSLETPSMGLVLLAVDYADRDLEGRPYQLRYFLQLVFRHERDGWRLVHDQNTLMEGGTA